MNVVLKPELERYVADQVKAGRFATAKDVVETALGRLMQEDFGDFEPGELDALLAEGEAGIARGDVLTPDKIREYFRGRRAQSLAYQEGS